MKTELVSALMCIEVQDAVEGLQCSEGNGVNCVIPLCPGLEELSHVKVCIFYQTKWSDKWTTDKELVDYLLKINRERLLVYKMPLFWVFIMYILYVTPCSQEKRKSWENYNLSFNSLIIVWICSHIRCKFHLFIEIKHV